MLEEKTNAERVLYSSVQKKSRVLIPKIVSLVSLSVIFYIGVLLIFSLLKLDAKQETTFKVGALIFLLLIILLGVFLSYKHSKKRYIFYRNRIYFNKNEVKYDEINNISRKKNIWDKMFKTYSLKLSKEFSVRHIPLNIELENYTQQMVNYSKGNHLIQTY